MTAASRVSGEGLLILHFILSSIDSVGSPAKILEQYMANFVGASNLHYEEIVFDISSEEKMNIHKVKMLRLGQHM